MATSVCLNLKAKTVVRLVVYGTLTALFVQKVTESALKLHDAKISTLTEEVFCGIDVGVQF